MIGDYLIVHKKILPEYYEKVVMARNLLSSGRVKEVSEAAARAGISRSTYYKYKDYIFEPSEMAAERKASISMMLSHEKGVLSKVLGELSCSEASILTISQSVPIGGAAAVLVSLDVSEVSVPAEEIVARLQNVRGVLSARLISIE
jgi:chorismate mutase